MEPSFSPENFVGGRVHAVFMDTDELLAVGMNTSSPEGDVAVLDMHYLIDADGTVTHPRERHELGCLPPSSAAGRSLTQEWTWRPKDHGPHMYLCFCGRLVFRQED